MTDKKQLQLEVEALFIAKQNRRRELCCLPFEEKIRLLIEMQKMFQDLPGNKNRGKQRVWAIRKELE